MDIKEKPKSSKLIKKLDKTIAWTERVKDPIVDVSRNLKTNNNNGEITDFGEDKINYYSNRMKDEAIYETKKVAHKTKDSIKDAYYKAKYRPKNKKNPIKKGENKIKTAKKVAKETEKNVERAKRVAAQAKKLAIKSAQATAKTVKTIGHAIVVGVKALIEGLSSLIGLLAGGGSIALIVVIVICLIGLLVASIFGIFFANEGNSRSMTSVISEVNTEIYQRAQNTAMLTRADDIVMDSTYSNWKEVIAVYSVKYSSKDSDNTYIAMYLNEDNVSKLKNIFYSFNTFNIEVKQEVVKVEEYIDPSVLCDGNDLCKNPPGQSSQFQNPNAPPLSVKPSTNNTITRNVLHISVSSQSVEDVMRSYRFNDEQKAQVRELLDEKYDDLWMNLLYGANSGKFVYWRQHDPEWSNIKLGTSDGTIGSIGCLATSIAILIEKSEANTNIMTFTPGTFVEAMNKVSGFDEDGNIYYGPISKVVPNFEYVGRIELKGLTQLEKLNKIKEYQDKGYYLAVEVKGNTGQHWVAVTGVNGNIIKMVDPGTDSTEMWNTYNWKNTSQFVYFKAKK